jgi:hypothetical protein
LGVKLTNALRKNLPLQNLQGLWRRTMEETKIAPGKKKRESVSSLHSVGRIKPLASSQISVEMLYD